MPNSKFLVAQFITMGGSKKDPYPPTEEISAVRRGVGKDCLNLYKMSGEGEVGIANFLQGGYGSFLEQPYEEFCCLFMHTHMKYTIVPRVKGFVL